MQNCVARADNARSMLRGLYVAAEGMAARQKAQDAIANNLANLNTTGFKADRPVFTAVYERALYRVQGGRSAPIGSLSAGAVVRELYTDLRPGAITTTGNPLDLAIDGAGFFAVQTPQGVRYTRNGAFQLNAQGILVNREGYAVLSTEGRPIQVPRNATVQIGENGTVLADGKPLAQLQIVEGRLTKDADGYFVGTAQPLTSPRVVVGALEASNVNLIRELVSMIEVIRAYETHQRVIHAHDETLSRAINELARL
ncbi:MAG: flagellar basal-body rod protein FlgF [Fimbriimonadales bacterium]|nr:flagellar basal-body rod protein FlgF [Fimbriimonadales bacterium]MDW8051828.1 flagellar basal-body rod protein FlgF [Armatimonadota bacterium]